jgi:hypothetical protein
MKHILERGGKVLYLTPLRALASEKYDEFKKYTMLLNSEGRKVKVAISTGDYDSSDSWLGKYDVMATVKGGGLTGQAEAVRHGIARALLEIDATLRPYLKKANLLTRDPRKKERKKYGQKAARKRFQYTKR